MAKRNYELLDLLDGVIDDSIKIRKTEVKEQEVLLSKMKKLNKATEDKIKSIENIVDGYNKQKEDNKKNDEKTASNRDKLAKVYEDQFNEERNRLQLQKLFNKEVKQLRRISVDQLKKDVKQRDRLLKIGDLKGAKFKPTTEQKELFGTLYNQRADQIEKYRLQDELAEQKFMTKGTLGLITSNIGESITGKIKEKISNVPYIGGLITGASGIRGFLREKREKQFELMQKYRDRQRKKPNISTKQKQDINEQSQQPINESIIKEEKIKDYWKIQKRDSSGKFTRGKANTGTLFELIEVNKKGFASIVSTLKDIDKGEDNEEIQNAKDEERRKGRWQSQPRDAMGRFTKTSGVSTEKIGDVGNGFFSNMASALFGNIGGGIVSKILPKIAPFLPILFKSPYGWAALGGIATILYSINSLQNPNVSEEEVKELDKNVTTNNLKKSITDLKLELLGSKGIETKKAKLLRRQIERLGKLSSDKSLLDTVPSVLPQLTMEQQKKIKLPMISSYESPERIGITYKLLEDQIKVLNSINKNLQNLNTGDTTLLTQINANGQTNTRKITSTQETKLNKKKE